MTEPSGRSFGMELQNSDAMVGSSPTASEVSVAQRRHWLMNATSQKQPEGQNHTDNNNNDANSNSSEPVKRKMVRKTVKRNGPTPLPTAAANVLVRRIIPRPASRPSFDNVQATNDGYASVAKLSQWLADDPTSNRKKKHTRHLTRGANILEKARAFDKHHLEGVSIVTQQHATIGGGVVAKHREWLEQQTTPPNPSNNNNNNKPWNVQLSPPKKKVTSNQKAIVVVPRSSQTDIVTNRDRHETAATLAKQKWRGRRSTVVAESDSSVTNVKPSETKSCSVVEPAVQAPTVDTTYKQVVTEPMSDTEPSPVEKPTSSIDRPEPAMGFQSARAIAILRSKTNSKKDTKISTRINTDVLVTDGGLGDNLTVAASEDETKGPTETRSNQQVIVHDETSVELTKCGLKINDTISTVSSCSDTDNYDHSNEPSNSVSKFRQLRESFAKRASVSHNESQFVSKNPNPIKSIEILTKQSAEEPRMDDSVSLASSTPSSVQSADVLMESMKHISKDVTIAKVEESQATENKPEPEKTSNLAFQQARAFVVERAKANGNNVDVLVQRRRAKFERLQKISKRKSEAHGLLRTTWEEEKQGSYVKTYREDAPKKKSLDQLP